MYAVIKTGGKQYRVQPGDVLVVEKLLGEPGDEIRFDQVLMVGEGEAVTVGAPLVADAEVTATFIETRKGEKIKIFKKIRRQGYRRTRGHRQWHSVLRVTAVAGGGASETWDGSVDLTPLSALNARARNLARGMAAAQEASVAKPPEPAAPKAKAKVAKPAAKRPAAKKSSEPAPVAKAPKAAKVSPAKSKTAKPAPAKAAKKAPAPKKAPKAPAAAKKSPKKS